MSSNLSIIDNFLNHFLTALSAGYANIQPEVNYFLGVMIILTIALTALFSWAWGEFDAVIRGLISRILIIGFVGYLATHWQFLTGVVANSFTALGLQAGGSGMSATSFLADPTNVVVAGFNLIEKMETTVQPLTNGIVMFFHNFLTILVYGVTGYILLFAFAWLALEIFVAILEFQFVNLAALVLVPFAIWQRTTWLSDGSFRYMFSAGLKLFVLALTVSIGMTFVNTWVVSPTPNAENACSLALGAVAFLIVSIKAPRLASALITGSPQFGGGDAAATAIGAAAGTAAAGYMATRGIAAVSGGLVNAGYGAAGVLGRYMAAANPGASAAAAEGGALGAAGEAASAGRGGGTTGGAAVSTNASGSASQGGGSGRTPNWMRQAGGFDKLSPTDQSAAQRAYQAWRKDAGPGMPYGLHSYVDYAQQKTAAEGGDSFGPASPGGAPDEEV
jgi:type IV secretion system protein TrbL